MTRIEELIMMSGAAQIELDKKQESVIKKIKALKEKYDDMDIDWLDNLLKDNEKDSAIDDTPNEKEYHVAYAHFLEGKENVIKDFVKHLDGNEMVDLIA